VPRGRVYANYVSRCATERVTVLNPASFGKLVRVLFPGLKTRRLGVRGESKYHYVNFSLQDDQPQLAESQNNQQIQSFNDPPNFAQSFKYVLPKQK
jgi:regulatory factor X, other